MRLLYNVFTLLPYITLCSCFSPSGRKFLWKGNRNQTWKSKIKTINCFSFTFLPSEMPEAISSRSWLPFWKWFSSPTMLRLFSHSFILTNLLFFPLPCYCIWVLLLEVSNYMHTRFSNFLFQSSLPTPTPPPSPAAPPSYSVGLEGQTKHYWCPLRESTDRGLAVNWRGMENLC